MESHPQRTNVLGVSLILIIVILSFGIILLNSCTLSITSIHTQGESSDVVDQNQEPNVSANLQIPVRPI